MIGVVIRKSNREIILKIDNPSSRTLINIYGDSTVRGVDLDVAEILFFDELSDFTVGDILPLELEESKSPPPLRNLDERVGVLEGTTSELDGRTEGMQGVDFFTLDNAYTTDQRTLGMQDVQDWTLELIFQLQQQVSDLQAQLEQI